MKHEGFLKEFMQTLSMWLLSPSPNIYLASVPNNIAVVISPLIILKETEKPKKRKEGTIVRRRR